MNRTISPQELKTRLSDGDVVVVDVRRDADYDADPHALPGAVRGRPEEVAQWSASLPPDQEVVVYCVRGGSVSNAVIDHLRASGLSARFIEGGIEAWKNAGGVVTDK